MSAFVGGVVATVGLGRMIDRDASFAIAFVDLHDEELGNRFLGRWIVNRNDTTDDQDAIVTFNASGNFTDNMDDTFDTRWFCDNGNVFLVNRSNDSSEGNAVVTPLIPTFNANADTVTLSPIRGDYKITLTRSVAGGGNRG
jgi:hypothetical protein